jgi:hypothetical protein
MRWFRITKANIDPKIRELFESRGVETIRAILPVPDLVIEHQDGTRFNVFDIRQPMLRWLKEQADHAERRETWLITREIAITLFVGAELIMSVINFVHGCSK